MSSRRGGFSLLELMMVMLISAVAAAGMTAVFRASEQLMGVSNVDLELQAEGEKALGTILGELRETGRVQDYVSGDPTSDFPYFFTDGAASGYFATQLYGHAPATQHVPPGSPAYGPSTEIIFKVLDDLDGDGKVTNQTSGAIEWSAEDFGYMLVTRPNGVNQLMRTNLTDGTETLVAQYVERVIFEDQGIDPTLGPNHIRVTLHLAKADPARPGWICKRFLVSVINMRNVSGQGVYLG